MKKYSVLFEVFGIAVMAGTGLWVADAVGLLGAAESGIMKLGIGAAAAYYFAMNFWAALHR